MVRLDSENVQQIKGATAQGEFYTSLLRKAPYCHHHSRWVMSVKLPPCTQQEPFASVCEGSAG